jgi:hypothetical protein
MTRLGTYRLLTAGSIVRAVPNQYKAVTMSASTTAPTPRLA